MRFGLALLRENLEQIANDDNAKSQALTGWRREAFGEDALRLKRGELAVADAPATLGDGVAEAEVRAAIEALAAADAEKAAAKAAQP